MDAKQTAVQPVKVAPVQPKPEPVRQQPIEMKVDTGKPSSSLPPLAQYPKPVKLYDKGGDVNAGKGKHQLAVLKDGEKVLTPEQAKNYEGKNMSEKKHVSLYRALHHLNKGGLHRALGVEEGKPIPAEKLEKAKNSDSEHIRHMANFAATMSHFKH